MFRIALLFAVVSAAPKGATEYKSEEWTQSIFRLDERPTIRYVKISELEFDWNHSGGLNSNMEFTSRKFKSGGKPKYEVKAMPVLNSFGYFQNELGLTRTYPNGARFDDMIYNKDGKLFEHRVREKKDGLWVSRVEYKNVDARPKGYTGLKRTCASCHDQAGTGGYGVGLVPGGDTVLSDLMDWDIIGK